MEDLYCSSSAGRPLEGSIELYGPSAGRWAGSPLPPGIYAEGNNMDCTIQEIAIARKALAHEDEVVRRKFYRLMGWD